MHDEDRSLFDVATKLGETSAPASVPAAAEDRGKSPSGLVYVVDDDARVRLALSRLLQEVACCTVQEYATAEEFLKADLSVGPACVLLDVRLPRVDGFDILASLGMRGHQLPVIFITGHGTIPMTVRAMQAGAVELLTKPFLEHQLIRAVLRALALDEAALERRREHAKLMVRYGSLTPREREVMQLAIGGLLNKQMADVLGTSEINVKVHKRHLMRKMQARSLADLVLMADRLQVKRVMSR
jgi:FixJ family two-component response regulator